MRGQDLRDATLFVSGLVLTIHEAIFRDTVRPEWLILFASMMGLPAYLTKRRNGV